MVGVRLSCILIASPENRIFHWKDYCLHPAWLCRAEREAAGTTETLADCHPPAVPHGWMSDRLSVCRC